MTRTFGEALQSRLSLDIERFCHGLHFGGDVAQVKFVPPQNRPYGLEPGTQPLVFAPITEKPQQLFAKPQMQQNGGRPRPIHEHKGKGRIRFDHQVQRLGQMFRCVSPILRVSSKKSLMEANANSKIARLRCSNLR
jgi:hypothetical protein